MSEYAYDDRRSRRQGRSRVPEYIETEETYIAKGGSGSGNRDLVLRQREDDYDDVGYARRSSFREDYGRRRARSSGYRDRDYYEDDYSEYSPRSRRGRRGRYDEDSYYSDDNERPRERRKSRVGEVIEGLGLGGVVAAVTGRSKSRRRRNSGGSDRSGYYDRDRSQSRGGDNRKKWEQAAKAAVITGVIEAIRSHKDPGPWTGEKGQRVATAALGAAGIDGILDRDPERRKKRHIVESVIGGLVTSHVANGSRRSTSRGRSTSRPRSQSIVERIRSRSRSVFGGRSASRGRSSSRAASRTRGNGATGLKDLAALGGVAAIGKAFYDRMRSKSRGRDQRGRSRSRSVSSEDSYVPSRQQRYGQRSRGGGPDREYGPTQDERGRGAEKGPGGTTNRDRDHSSDSVSTTDLENQRKKTRTKELLTAGLATVATIHAAHGVYNSMVASEKRHKMVEEGEMSPEEARKRKSKNMLQDAAAVGIAALGIKSAFTEWKEMNESRREKHEIEAKHRKRQKARERRARETKDSPNHQDYGYGYGSYPPGPGYNNANPYQAYAGSLPPPPVPGPNR